MKKKGDIGVRVRHRRAAKSTAKPTGLCSEFLSCICIILKFEFFQ